MDTKFRIRKHFLSLAKTDEINQLSSIVISILYILISDCEKYKIITSTLQKPEDLKHK